MSLYFLLMSYLRYFIILFFVCFFLLSLSSYIYTGVQSYVTPGVVVLAYAEGQPVINEFLSHPGSGSHEWVELYVPDGSDVTGYWIDDDTDFSNDSGSSVKKQITSVIQGSDTQHVVFVLSSSMLNNDGDTVALFSPDGTLVDHYTYTKDPGENVTIGRTPDGSGDFQVLASATQGSPNSAPQPTVTPTPQPTEKPTPTSKPTATPTPIKTKSIPTILPTTSSLTSTKSVLSDQIAINAINKKIVSPFKTASNGAYPTAILHTSNKVNKSQHTSAPIKHVLVKGITNTLPQIVAVSIGGLLLLSCGILMYLKKVKANK
jgi:hypothetical protein